MLRIKTRVNEKFIDMTISTPSTVVDLGLFDVDQAESALIELETSAKIIRHQIDRLKIYAKTKPQNKIKNIMKQTLNSTQAVSILMQDEYADWSRNGAEALVEYLEQYEDDCGEVLEFCPVAIRCDFAEYESLQDWYQDYHGEALEGEAEEVEDEIRQEIEENGTLIEFDGGIIVSSF